MNRIATYLVAVAVLVLVVSPLMALNVVGTVKAVNADQNQLVITDQNGRDWTIQVGQNAQIMANNNQARLADLRPGQVVNVAYDLQNNQMVASGINAQATQTAQQGQGQQGQQGQQQQRAQQQPAQQQQAQQQDQQATEQGQARGQQGQQTARGKIERINADQHQFTLKDDNGRELTFHCGKNARVEANGQEAKLADLKEGQEISVMYRQELTDIRTQEKNAPAENAQQQGQGRTVQGQIQQVQAAQHQIRLRDQNGRDRTFQVGQNAQVQVNGRNGTLADLQQGQQVTATAQMVVNEIRTGGQNPNR